jgi:NADH-quinone oxidoreductase subunit M
LPDAALAAAPFIAVLAIIGIIYTSLAAWIQSDIKKLVAYSSVAHLGFCMLGMFAFNHTGLSASLLYMINHGLSTGALFLVVGMIYERYHTREFAHLGGLARKMPILAFFLILFSLSSIGLPGLNGFVSEFSVLYAVFTSARTVNEFAGPLGPTYAIIAATGVILSAIYMLWMCQRVLFGPLKEPDIHHDETDPDRLPIDLSQREWALLTPIAVLVVLLGVYPKLYFNATDPAIAQLNQQITSDIKVTDNKSDYALNVKEQSQRSHSERSEESLNPEPETLDPKPYQSATAVSAVIPRVAPPPSAEFVGWAYGPRVKIDEGTNTP